MFYFNAEDDLIGKTKHEIEDILNARAPSCPPEVSAEDARRMAARIGELEKERDGYSAGLSDASQARDALMWEAQGEKDRADALAALLREAREVLRMCLEYGLVTGTAYDRALALLARLEAREVSQ